MATYVVFSTQAVEYQGRRQPGAFIRFFDAGTNTPRVAYSNGLLTVAYPPNAITADIYGCLPAIFVQDTPYKARFLTADGVLIREIDNIPANAVAVTGGGGGGGTTIPTGAMMPFYGVTAPAGWVRCNGRTIGSALSSASERANDDCQVLFIHIWTVDALLAVSGGRGATAAADWAANKTIGLPTARGKAIIGLDDMGNASAGMLAGITFTQGNGTTLGSFGGAATYTLDVTQMPLHSHDGFTAAGGSHQHTGYTYDAGAHNHTGYTDTAPDHAHISYAPSGSVFGGVSASSASGTGLGGTLTTYGGAHLHYLTINYSPNHSHYFISDLGGSHAHSFSTFQVGGATSVKAMPPFLLATQLIKL